MAALTFDDGPDDDTTEALLDILAAAEVPATFFVVGQLLDTETWPLIRRMHDEGHEIANHTFRHARHFDRQYGENSAHWVLSEIELCEMAINLALNTESTRDFRRARRAVFEQIEWDTSAEDTVATIGSIQERYEMWLAEHSVNPRRSRYFRPPGGAPYYGSNDFAPAVHNRWAEAMERSGMLQVIWHRDTRDWSVGRRSDQNYVFKETLTRLLNAIHRGGIVLMHDRSNPEICARRPVPRLRVGGYRICHPRALRAAGVRMLDRRAAARAACRCRRRPAPEADRRRSDQSAYATLIRTSARIIAIRLDIARSWEQRRSC